MKLTIINIFRKPGVVALFGEIGRVNIVSFLVKINVEIRTNNLKFEISLS